jgi:arsenate reductase (thioredoxin)
MATTGSALESAPLEIRTLIRHVAARVRDDFAGIFGPETVERFIADSYSALSKSKVQSFVPLFVERFTRDRLRALAKVEGLMASDAPSVVFLCVHNAGRSQMAAGWLQYLASDDVHVFSGGSDPESEVNPAAVEAMAEVGIDISREFPKPWTDEIVRAADVIVTMGCGDACPVFPGKRYEDWEVDDPAGKSVEDVRKIRDDIEGRVRNLVAEIEIRARNGTEHL